MELLKSILYANKGKETVLGNLAERFTEFDHDEKSLLICIVSGTCDLRYGVALHMTVMSEFDIVPFTTLPGENTRFGWIRGVMDTPPNDIPRIIILSGGDRDRLEWTLEFLHESIHFADFALINDWLSANDKLARHGHGPDDLFRQYVRPGPDNRLQVDEGFLRIFLESRAYGGEIAYFESFLEPRLRKSMTEKQKRRVMDDIRGFQTVTQPIAKKLNLTSDSVFKVGERLGRKMMATIKRAKEL